MVSRYEENLLLEIIFIQVISMKLFHYHSFPELSTSSSSVVHVVVTTTFHGGFNYVAAFLILLLACVFAAMLVAIPCYLKQSKESLTAVQEFVMSMKYELNGFSNQSEKQVSACNFSLRNLCNPSVLSQRLKNFLHFILVYTITISSCLVCVATTGKPGNFPDPRNFQKYV